MTSKTITLYLAVNDDGEFQYDADSAADAAEELLRGYSGAAIRIITINVTLDLPIPEIVNVDAPAQSQAPAVVTVS